MSDASDDQPAGDLGRPSSEIDEWILGGAPESLADLVNHVLDRGVVAHGDVTISVAGVDLVYLGLNALLTSVSTARRTLGAPVSAPFRNGGETERGEVPATRRGDAERVRDPAPVAPPAPSEAVMPPPRDPLAAELTELTSDLPARLELDPDGVQRDLARLVLTLVELLRRVVEHQAVKRMEDGDLSEAQIERMGVALLRLEEKLQEIKAVFGLADHELNIDLGPLGKLL